MKKDIVKSMGMLLILAAISGCSSFNSQKWTDANARPILSAAEAETQIRVTVRTLAPAADPETIVATRR